MTEPPRHPDDPGSSSPPPFGPPPSEPPPYRPSPSGQPPSGQPQYSQPQYSQPQYEPQYGQPQEQSGRYGPPPQTPAQRQLDFSTLLGPRVLRRPEARFGPSLAAVGAVLALLGAAVWSIGYFAAGFGIDFDDSGPGVHGESRRFLGAGIFLVLAVVGYALVIVRRRGPLATAGTVASATGVPLMLGFAFLDIGGTFSGDGFPINLDVVFLISIIVWLVTYFAVPGARGRTVYLALAASGLYGYLAVKVGATTVVQVGATAVAGSGGVSAGSSNNHSGAITALGLVFGLGYYTVAALLDGRGRAGAAVALVLAAFGATVGGLAAAADSIGQVGTGLLLIGVGAALALYGGHFGRRFTTWIWSAGIVVGVVLVVAKIGLDAYVTVGVVLIVVGAVVAAGAQAVVGLVREAPDLDESRAAASSG